MNNLLYCGLVEAKTRASDKDLPVLQTFELGHHFGSIKWMSIRPAHFFCFSYNVLPFMLFLDNLMPEIPLLLSIMIIHVWVEKQKHLEIFCLHPSCNFTLEIFLIDKKSTSQYCKKQYEEKLHFL